MTKIISSSSWTTKIIRPHKKNSKKRCKMRDIISSCLRYRRKGDPNSHRMIIILQSKTTNPSIKMSKRVISSFNITIQLKTKNRRRKGKPQLIIMNPNRLNLIRMSVSPRNKVGRIRSFSSNSIAIWAIRGIFIKTNWIIQTKKFVNLISIRTWITKIHHLISKNSNMTKGRLARKRIKMTWFRMFIIRRKTRIIGEVKNAF